MRRTERLLHLLERLRSAKRPITATELASELEVTERTIYRDVKLLNVQGLPIHGEAGIGYVMDEGFNAPALQFTADELEILSIGLRLVYREGDVPMQRTAEMVLSKIQAGIHHRTDFDSIDLYAAGGQSHPVPFLTKIRQAIRKRAVIEIEYASLDDNFSKRLVKPIALHFFNSATLVAGFCELRQDFRSFRVDRIQALAENGNSFQKEHFKLRRTYLDMKRKQRENHLD